MICTVFIHCLSAFRRMMATWTNPHDPRAIAFQWNMAWWSVVTCVSSYKYGASKMEEMPAAKAVAVLKHHCSLTLTKSPKLFWSNLIYSVNDPRCPKSTICRSFFPVKTWCFPHRIYVGLHQGTHWSSGHATQVMLLKSPLRAFSATLQNSGIEGLLLYGMWRESRSCVEFQTGMRALCFGPKYSSLQALITLCRSCMQVEWFWLKPAFLLALPLSALRVRPNSGDTSAIRFQTWNECDT